MFSTTEAKGPPDGEEEAGKMRDAARLAAEHFGLDLYKYPKAQIEALLTSLTFLPRTNLVEDAATVARILSVCSVGETMFMRHPDQLRALVELCNKGLVGDPGRILQVWSAGCATGEEAYSLSAILGARNAGVRVLATDVSRAAIERGKQAQYRMWSLRGTDPLELGAWVDIDGLQAIVRASVRERVVFSEHNLVRDVYPTDLDVIVCRNVLLYFRNETANVVLEKFYQSLRPGGVLILGYVDPVPLESGPFVEMYQNGVRYYRKGRADDEIQRAKASPSSPPRRISVRPSPPSPPSPPVLTQPLTQNMPVSDLRERIELARGLCGQGARQEALQMLVSITTDHPLEVEPYVLLAMVADEAGERATALVSARRAYFLAPNAPITAFLLASCLERVGERKTAETRYEEARRGLDGAGEVMEPLLYGEGLTAFQLRRTIDARSKRG